jgi:uncharacterized membrane protein YqjE
LPVWSFVAVNLNFSMPAATATANPAAARNARAAERPTLGVMDSVRTLLASATHTVRTRLEIISAELEEQREWLQNLMLLAVAGVFCACMGLVLVTLFVVALFWQTHPLAVLGGFSLLYLGVGIWALATLRYKLHARPKFFFTTTQELAKDEEHLTPR